MKKATFDQATHLLTIAQQQPHFSLEWLQDFYDSGIISDVFGVREPKKLDREAVRKALGHGPLNPPLLEILGVITIAATPELVANEQFVVGGKIRYVGENFKAWLYGKTEKRALKTKIRYAKLIRSAFDDEIRKEIGADLEEATLAQIDALMERQKNGESGVLLTNGYANIFYVRDANGVLRAVSVVWRGVGWFVHAYSVAFPDRWRGGYRVFSRNS